MHRSLTLAILLLTLLFSIAARPAWATIQLPDDAGERDMTLQLLRDLCRDYALSYEKNAAGHWIVKIGQKITEVDKTPDGCGLVTRLVNHQKTVTIGFDGSIIAGQEIGETPADGTMVPGGDPGGRPGPGTNATVTIDPNIVPPTAVTPAGKRARGVVGYDAAGKLLPRRAPRVVILGHELIHALHDMDGTTTNDPEGQTIDVAGPGATDITENNINDEQQRADNYKPPLGRRSGHCGELA